MEIETKRDQMQREYLLKKDLYERRQNDPLRNFQPAPKQKAFIDAVLYGDAMVYLLATANRSGKSIEGAYLDAYLVRFGFPNDNVPCAGWFISPDFASSRDIIQPKIFNNGILWISYLIMEMSIF